MFFKQNALLHEHSKQCFEELSDCPVGLKQHEHWCMIAPLGFPLSISWFNSWICLHVGSVAHGASALHARRLDFSIVPLAGCGLAVCCLLLGWWESLSAVLCGCSPRSAPRYPCPHHQALLGQLLVAEGWQRWGDGFCVQGAAGRMGRPCLWAPPTLPSVELPAGGCVGSGQCAVFHFVWQNRQSSSAENVPQK